MTSSSDIPSLGHCTVLPEFFQIMGSSSLKFSLNLYNYCICVCALAHAPSVHVVVRVLFVGPRDLI